MAGFLFGNPDWAEYLRFAPVSQDGEFVDVTYDWRIKAEKPQLRYGSFALRPFFRANHRWAMARGLESLELELGRRRREK